MAEAPRARLRPARTARAPGRGLRSPRRALPARSPRCCGTCSLSFGRGPSPGARRARHAPRAECAASPVAAAAAAASAGNAVHLHQQNMLPAKTLPAQQSVGDTAIILSVKTAPSLLPGFN